MPLSKDPRARERQLSNLRPDAALKHAGRADVLIRGRADELLAELLEEFPAASPRVLRLQARRAAKLERLAAFLEERGEFRNRRQGEVFAASAIEESVTAAFLATQAKLEAQAREARSKPGSAPSGALADELQASRAAWERHRPSNDDTEEATA